MIFSSLLRNIGASMSARRRKRGDSAAGAYAGPPVHLVSATRLNAAQFWERSLLGASLRRADFNMPLRHTIAFENSTGLSSVYNRALDTLADNEAVVFVHDDVVLYDFFLPHRVADGLRRFDVIGVAGNSAPLPDHAGWCARLPTGHDKAVGDDLSPGESTPYSGAVNHIFPTHEVISHFGPAPRKVALLDGLFLAASVSALRRSGARFDERFQFHFYDVDFCRTCVARGLRIGTWPIALGHGSTGGYNTPQWRAALVAYREKWGVTAPRVCEQD